MNTIIKYENTNNLVKDVCTIIDEAKQFVYQTVDTTLVLRNWYIGKRIDEEVLEGKDRAKYKLYLPTEEELREEIETQKEFYYLQKKDEEKEKLKSSC
ncbi:MAG: hypothetical protein K6G87_05640 [Butyrivibrio sp.]|uniref:hypothetical protein n=1 Tax=Butyrivibrio sp. TaxID=28121 RepID=UPI0025CCBD53|nr:hypothetical protein [Butyrivibrio sp.]MCR5770705.1 hypothetical protein [Butyrivibrio sp.]